MRSKNNHKLASEYITMHILNTVTYEFENKRLSYHRDRTASARCVSFNQKWKYGTGIRYFVDIIGLSLTNVT